MTRMVSDESSSRPSWSSCPKPSDLEGLPLVAEQPVVENVVPLAVTVDHLAPGALWLEAGLLEGADGPSVVRDRGQPDAVQVQLVEGVAEQQRDGVAAVPFAPVLWIADGDTEHGTLVHPLNRP